MPLPRTQKGDRGDRAQVSSLGAFRRYRLPLPLRIAGILALHTHMIAEPEECIIQSPVHYGAAILICKERIWASQC